MSMRIRPIAALIALATALSAFAAAPQWSTGTYAYDPSGNIKSIGTGAGGDAYGYDSVARIIYATLKGEMQPYSYDPYGNLLKLGAGDLCADERTNRLCGPHEYDPAGNLTADKKGRRFHYDAIGMVVAVDVAMTDTALSDMRAIYTADDERIVIFQGPTDRYRLRDFDKRVLREWKDTGGPLEWVRDYIYAGNTLVAGEVHVDPALNPFRHYHLDHLGSIRLVTDGSASLISAHDYLPFGAELPSTPTTPRDPLKFTGHERDYFSAENVEGDALDYMHARYYGPGNGRFLTIDPVLDTKTALLKPQTWNRYSYVRNNPINGKDPDGRLTIVMAGTFAENATWHEPGTPFNQAVSQRFGEDAKVFRWSGDNNKSGRAEAAKQLREFIAKNRKPGEPLNIVAHSHGGNVVKAYTQLDGAQKINTLINLGTPQRHEYKINPGMVENYINVYSRADNIQTTGDTWWQAPANRAGRTDPLARNVDVTHATASPAGVGHSELHTPDVFEKVPPQ
jgi:RHS repeat-associated protein